MVAVIPAATQGVAAQAGAGAAAAASLAAHLGAPRGAGAPKTLRILSNIVLHMSSPVCSGLLLAAVMPCVLYALPKNDAASSLSRLGSNLSVDLSTYGAARGASLPAAAPAAAAAPPLPSPTGLPAMWMTRRLTRPRMTRPMSPWVTARLSTAPTTRKTTIEIQLELCICREGARIWNGAADATPFEEGNLLARLLTFSMTAE